MKLTTGLSERKVWADTKKEDKIENVLNFIDTRMYSFVQPALNFGFVETKKDFINKQTKLWPDFSGQI